jgi:ABC-type Mn2+/Zn2+ transport system ATPase subunit
MEPLIQIAHLTFGDTERTVLEDVTLDIEERDFILVIGPNGGERPPSSN